MLGAVATTARQDANVSGVSLWQLYDTRTYDSSDALHRPRSFNNKGLLDEHRRPKALSVAVVKAAFGADEGFAERLLEAHGVDGSAVREAFGVALSDEDGSPCL